LQEEALAKVSNFLNTVDTSKYRGEVKSKFVFWTNELIEKLEEESYEETLAHLSYKTDVSIDFHESVLSESRRFNVRTLKPEFEKRVGNQDEYIVTIDGEGAEEIDDGLSIKKLENGNYLLGVHISDPLGYISRNSLLYEEANRRTTSIYSPLERTSSMFPEAYAKDHMSLMQGKNRLATSYYLEITPCGEILLDRCVFKKTIVNVNKKLTYDEFNILSKTGSSNERLDETIESLLEVTDLLSKRIIMDENYRIANREASNVSGTNITGTSSSEKLVEYAMLAANSTVASYAAKKGIPFIYRGHETNKDYLAKIDYFDKKFRENPTSENYEVFVKLLRDTYPSAFYTTDSSIKHMGIGVEHYSHITSPLRRFADCLANEALNLMYFNEVSSDKEVYKLEERLKEGCRYINEKKTSIDYFTDRYVKVKK
jgi:ribonuclease R